MLFFFLRFIFIFLTETPQGQLPILTIDGTVVLPQSLAIARFLAMEFGKIIDNYKYSIHYS